MPDPRRIHDPPKPRYTWLWRVLLALLGLGLMIVATGLESPLRFLGMALFIGCVTTVPRSEPAPPHRVGLEQDALAVWLDRRWVRYPFAQMTVIRSTPWTLSLQLPRRRLELDYRLSDWDELREALLSALGEPARVVTGEVSPSQLEAWLGVPPRGRLRCRTSVWQDQVPAVMFAGFGSFVAVMPLVMGESPWRALGTALYAWALAWLCLRSRQVIDVDRHGLNVHRGRRVQRIAWSEIVELRQIEATWAVIATSGEVTLFAGLPAHELLADTIRNVLDARDRGEALPVTEGISDAAISLHRLTAPEVQRGISLIREETDDA